MHQSQPLRLYPTGGHFAAKYGGHFKTENGGQLHAKSWGSITHEIGGAIWTEYPMYNHYNNVYAIANQCPYAGGPAVYIARGLLRIVNDSIEYFDDVICLQAGYYRTLNSNIGKKYSIKLLPNPAKDKVDVFSDHPHDVSCPILIYNSMGELVYSSLSEIGVLLKTIDVSSFVPGVYAVSVVENTINYSVKLVVIK